MPSPRGWIIIGLKLGSWCRLNRSGVGLRPCNSNRLPGEVNCASPWTTPWVDRVRANHSNHITPCWGLVQGEHVTQSWLMKAKRRWAEGQDGLPREILFLMKDQRILRRKQDRPLCNVTGRLEALNNGSYLVTKRDTLEKSQSTEEENEGNISEPSKSPDSYCQTSLLSKI